MNWADWTILGIIGISSLISLKRGFAKEALSLVTWVMAFIIARVFAQALAISLEAYIETPSVRIGAAFIILFVAVLVIGALISKLMSTLIDATGLSGTDRVLGMGFGAVRGGLVVVVVIAFVGMSPAVNDGWYRESQLIPHFAMMETWTKEVASDIGRLIWNAGS